MYTLTRKKYNRVLKQYINTYAYLIHQIVRLLCKSLSILDFFMLPRVQSLNTVGFQDLDHFYQMQQKKYDIRLQTRLKIEKKKKKLALMLHTREDVHDPSKESKSGQQNGGTGQENAASGERPSNLPSDRCYVLSTSDIHGIINQTVAAFWASQRLVDDQTQADKASSPMGSLGRNVAAHGVGAGQLQQQQQHTPHTDLTPGKYSVAPSLPPPPSLKKHMGTILPLQVPSSPGSPELRRVWQERCNAHTAHSPTHLAKSGQNGLACSPTHLANSGHNGLLQIQTPPEWERWL